MQRLVRLSRQDIDRLNLLQEECGHKDAFDYFDHAWVGNKEIERGRFPEHPVRSNRLVSLKVIPTLFRGGVDFINGVFEVGDLGGG